MTAGGLAPLRALRYQTARVGELGRVWAPPYDVITSETAGDLRRGHPYNIVRLTNPEGGEERYREAARVLADWVADGVLARDAQPAVYLHRHRFAFRGADFVRLGAWGLLRLERLDAGVVLPHERTMSGPKADRLALMRACRAQLSPIFFICADRDGRLHETLSELACGGATERTEFPAGEWHELWRVESRGAGPLLALFHERTQLIADGHHRYETALAYRDELIQGGALQTGRQTHEFVLAYLVSENDPGLLLLPTHRAVGGSALDWAGAIERLRDRFQVRMLDVAELEAAALTIEQQAGRPTLLLYEYGRPHAWRLELKQKDDDRGGVASVTFDELLLGEGLGLSPQQRSQRLSFHHDPFEALARVRSRAAQAAALLAPPRVTQVRALAAAGVRLPPKTTYFWPKVPTGIAIHPIDPQEQLTDGD